MKNRLIVLILICGFSSCKPKDDCETIPSEVSFSKAVQPIFDRSCNTSGCHQGTTPAGGLDLSAAKAYDQLSSVGSGYVKAGNSAGSLLYLQMNSITNPMPPTGKLDACEINLVKGWIDQGGLEN